MVDAPYYDLMVLLDPESADEQRSRVIEQIRSQISSGSGTVKGDADWGLRRLAYEIDHRPEAHYHLFQLQAGTTLLEQLDRNLSIEDAVLRHRIIRLPGEPPEVTPRPEPTAAPAASEPEPAADEAADASEPAAEPVSETAAEPVAETAAEPVSETAAEPVAEPAAELPAEQAPASEPEAPAPDAGEAPAEAPSDSAAGE